MNYIDLIKDIDQGKLNNIILFNVSESYLYDMAIDIIKKDMLDQAFLDLNFLKYDFESIEKNTFTSAVETLPFMDQKRFILIENLVLERDKIKKYEDKFDFIMSYIENINPSTFLLLTYEGSSMFKGKFVNSVIKNGQVYDISRLNRKDFLSFIAKYFAKNKIKIDRNQATLIADRLGYTDRDSKLTLYEAVNEMQKLVNSIDTTTPDMKLIEEVVTEHFDDNIFKLTDALCNRDIKLALELNSRMKEEPANRVFSMILRQVRILIGVQSCIDNRVSKASGMKYLKIGSFEYDKGIRFVRNFNMNELLGIHKKAASLEMNSRAGMDAEDAVKRLILEFRR